MKKEQKMDPKTGLMNPKAAKPGQAIYGKQAVRKQKKSSGGHVTVKGNR
jgi:hypothetical protein